MLVHRYCATSHYTTEDGEPRSIRRGSDTSHDDAIARTNEAAGEASRKTSHELEWYDYGGPGRAEAIVDEVFDEEGARAGAVTVNRDGILVLNTATLVFVDVDLPKPARPSAPGLLGRIFGKKQPAHGPPADPRGDALAALASWLEQDHSRGARVYETAAGLRYLITAPSLDPCSESCEKLMQRLGADPLYRVLCRAQACFRARLTPKPWRVPGSPRVRLYRPPAQGEPRADRRAARAAT